MPKGYVQNVLNVLEYKLEEMWMLTLTLLDRFVNELLIFTNHRLPPNAMLPFDGAIYVIFCNNFSVHGLLGNSLTTF